MKGKGTAGEHTTNDLSTVYYDRKHPSGYSTPWRLWQTTRKAKPEIRRFLQAQDTYTLHTPARRKFPRNRTYADVADDCWQADLTDLTSLKDDNDNLCFILCVICVFSRYAWCVPIKDKSAKTVCDAFRHIFNTTTRRCARLITDKGKEFDNTLLKKLLNQYGTEYYHTNNAETKASICERFQRTLKTQLFKVFTHTEQYRYVDGVLDDLVHAYNHRYHRSIKMSPVEASLPEKTLEVYDILYGKKEKHRAPKLQVGDFVRISREKKHFEKGYTWYWSEEVFKIKQVIAHTTPCYKIEDFDGHAVIGSFYEPEIQKVAEPERFKIAYIVQSKGKNNSLRHLVHWRGYPEKSRSWVLAKDITTS